MSCNLALALLFSNLKGSKNLSMNSNTDEQENKNHFNLNFSNSIDNAEFLKGTIPSPCSGNSLQLSYQSHLISNFCKQQQSQPFDSYHFMLSDHLNPKENSRDGHDADNDCDNFDSFEDMQWDLTTFNI